MRIKYYAATDSLYIELLEIPSSDSREASEGVVLDYDAAGKVVGIDIDNASTRVALDALVVNGIPGIIMTG